MTDPSTAARDERAAAGWLAAQQDVAGRAAHELKNTLNGVAVNLEVVRSRLARPGVQPEQVQRFAEAAVDQLDQLTRQVEALLALTRAAREPVDVGATVRQLLALRPPDTTVSLAPGDAPLTSADPALVRLALASALRAGVPSIDATADGRARVRVDGAGPLDPATLALLAPAGVDATHEGPPEGAPTLTLIFPARGPRPAETEI